MAHNSYIGGSLAAWSTGTTVSPAQWWALDQAQFQSINGDAGGAWSPAAVIDLGGAFGLRLSASTPFSALGNTVIGATDANTLTVNASPTFVAHTVFSNTSWFVGTATFSGASGFIGTATFTGNVVIGNASTDTLTVTSASEFNTEASFFSDLTIGADVDVQTLNVVSTETHYGTEAHGGACTFSGGLVVTGGATVSSYIAMNAGSQIPRRTLWLADSGATVRCDEYDEVVVSGLTDSAKTVFLSPAGAAENSHIAVVNTTAATWQVGVAQSGGFSTTVQAMRRGVFVFHLGAWQKKYETVIV